MSEHGIETIAIVGAGLMGQGIGQEIAAAGYQVRLHDLSEEILQTALQSIERNLATLRDLDLVSDDTIKAACDRIHLQVDLGEAVANADLVIETVTEDLQVKRRVFAALDDQCPPHTILASNSSSFMPSQMASTTRRPEKVLVTHYFNPPYLMPLVEIVRSDDTKDDVVSTVHQFMIGIGKRPVVVRREVPGFIGNRLQMALIRECLSLVESGVASVEDIDTVVKNGFGRRLAIAGPFQLFDIGGWNVIYGLRELFEDIESSPRLSRLVLDMVERGDLGVRTGKGFYDWTPESAETLREQIASRLAEMEKWSS